MSDLADGAPESASKKAKFGNAEIREFEKATKSDAEEEESDDLESPKKKRKVVSEEGKAAIKAKKAEKEAERKAEKERKEKLARDKKELAEQKKISVSNKHGASSILTFGQWEYPIQGLGSYGRAEEKKPSRCAS